MSVDPPQQLLPNVAVPTTYPPLQQQPVMMVPGAVQYVSGQQPTVQFIPAAVSWNFA